MIFAGRVPTPDLVDPSSCFGAVNKGDVRTACPTTDRVEDPYSGHPYCLERSQAIPGELTRSYAVVFPMFVADHEGVFHGFPAGYSEMLLQQKPECNGMLEMVQSRIPHGFLCLMAF